MSEINQLITFEGKPVTLAAKQKWSIHRIVTTSGLMPSRVLQFEDYDQATHKWQDGNFHLFELRKEGGIRLIAYCAIKSIG